MRAVRLLLLLAMIASVSTGCQTFRNKFGRFFGGGPCPANGAAAGIESSALPEPIRGETPQEIADLKRVFFAFDSASLLDPAKQQLSLNAQWLKANPNVHVQIEGHCDERGTQEYNYALGQRRADAARTFLISQGVDAQRLHTISYGSERPDDPGHDQMAWARNRRVQFMIYSGK